MSDTLTEREIDEQLGLRHQRFEQVIQDIRKLLQHDLEGFFVRETKKTFLSEIAVAEGLSDEAILALRKDAQALGRREGERVASELADLERWKAGEALARLEGKHDLSEVAEVWDVVRSSEAALVVFLRGHGFAVPSTPTYRPPAFFVAGLYMPGLNEHYWRILHEVQELHAQRAALAAKTVRDRLQARWDAAEKA